jgi:hypothetical protein
MVVCAYREKDWIYNLLIHRGFSTQSLAGILDEKAKG